MTVSIIIPVYNVEKYLKDCLESIVNQTYKDLEIICVNDGSTDNSLNILEEYQKKDNRIKIINQQNQGQSIARNTGINIATGDFIAFIDSDDWIDCNYFEKLYNALVETNSDIALASVLRTRKNSSKYRVKYLEQKTYEKLDDIIKVADIPRCCYTCNKLYKIEFAKNNLFDSGVYYEDVLWSPKILEQSNKIVTVPDIIYYYRVNPNSTVKTKQNTKKQLDSYNSKKFIIDFFKKHNLQLAKKHQNITKKIIYIFNIPILKIKEKENVETTILFGFLPIRRKRIEL